MSRIQLRSYQEQALAAEDEYRAAAPEENRLLIEMATGLGKSITLSERARRFLKWGGNRVLIIVHTDELVQQLAEDARFMAAGDGFSVGIVKARQNDVAADIIVASVATLIQPGRMEQIADVGYLIVDEAHHAVAASYIRIMRHFGAMPTSADYEANMHDAMWRPIPVLGMTATPMRSDGQGLGKVWHNLVFSRDLIWGIRHGYLIDIVPYSVYVPVTMSTTTSVDAQLADSLAPEVVVQAWREKCPELPSTILFAPLVKSAQAFADAFSIAGVKAEVVSDRMSKAEIKGVLDRFRAGVTTVLCNAMMLTEGVNIPRIMCVIWGRPVRREGSPLLTQGVGRGTRPWLAAEAPPREEQRMTLLVVTPETSGIPLAGVADLSAHAAEGRDGVSLLTMEDQWDLGKDLPDESVAYAGPVAVERWDAAVRASTKAWKYTKGGVPFLPFAKKGEGYVFVVERDDSWTVWVRGPAGGRMRTAKEGAAPDLELAMAVAEDVVQERGGSVGTLIADRNRPWRDGVPSAELQALARQAGLGRDLDKIMAQRAAGKAGKVSDLVDKVMASRVLDPTVEKIKSRGQR